MSGRLPNNGLPGKPTRGGYLARNPMLHMWLRVSDAFLRWRIRRSSQPGEPLAGPPASVLVAVSGHRGDAIVATAFLDHLRRALPAARIGVLTGHGNRHIFAGDARVQALHLAEHWRLDRSGATPWVRWLRSRETERSALREIRAAQYDASVELSPHFPSAARLFWHARIPRRIGYATGGGGPLLTTVVPWVAGRHMGDDHLALLSAVTALPISEPRLDAYRLRPMSPEGQEAGRAALQRLGVTARAYAVIHAGSGSPVRVWPVEQWRAVIDALLADGVPVLVSGFGEDEARRNRRICAGMSGAIDITNRVDWDESRSIISNAAVVLCANTMVMHLAAADDAPVVVIMDGTDSPERWRPPGANVVVLTHPVPCSPCFRSHGCATMSCLAGVTPEQVLRASRIFLKAARHAAVPG